MSPEDYTVVELAGICFLFGLAVLWFVGQCAQVIQAKRQYKKQFAQGLHVVKRRAQQPVDTGSSSHSAGDGLVHFPRSR